MCKSKLFNFLVLMGVSFAHVNDNLLTFEETQVVKNAVDNLCVK